jgi:DNA repair ATPase RecN
MPRVLGERFADFIREKGWTAEEGVKILLAYGADALTLPDRTFSEVFNEWAAARAELASLRHRAYLADEAIRGLQMNITGLEATNAQFQESLALQEARRARLRRVVAELEAQLGGEASPGQPSSDDAPDRAAAADALRTRPREQNRSG